MTDEFYRRPCRLTAMRAALPGLAASALATCLGGPAEAQRDEQAVARRVEIDWPAAARDAQALSPLLAAPTTSGRWPPQHLARARKRLESYTVKEDMLPLALLNERAGQIYRGVESVPIPVLAPVDATRLLTEWARASGGKAKEGATYHSPSIVKLQFVAGPSGYDMIATTSAKAMRDHGLAVGLKPQLHIAGSVLMYDGDEPGEPVPELQDLYPGLRRTLGAEEVTYTFRKYGVPYFVNVNCSNDPPVASRLSCRQADAIVREALRGLRLIGGAPLEIKRHVPRIVPQPTKAHPDFKFHAPGSLIPGTSEQNRGGSTSRVIYGSNLLFPIRQAPAYANTQVFLHWGDCLGQRIDIPEQPGDQFDRYKCPQTGKELLHFEGHVENYAYPWRDNYCEARGDGNPSGCPLSKGHAGQDLRPGNCMPDTDNERCRIDLFDVVAVIDGRSWWKEPPYENHLRLQYDDGSNKLYFMYLHMSPTALRDAGMKKGMFVPVARGQRVGKIGNFDKATPGATTAHLHFEVRLGNNIGVPRNPYMTLVRAYERLLRATGTELP
ncbi:MAG: M23 family metallopeptidase [Hyphomicrobiaceae bacterium]